MQEITGQIIDIIYKNEINSYTICEVNEKELGDITIVGYLPFINVGDSIKAYGKMVIHKEYGEQFKVETFEKTMPEGLDALKIYLGSGLIKGIGPAIAKKIVDKFGEETILILKTEPEKLSKIKGITLNKSIEIAEEFNEKWELWQIVSFLESFGIGANNANRVYKELGIDAINKIEENPYVLVDIVYGIDFKQIDKIALSRGVDVNFNKRIESAIKYSLIIASNNGNTCVRKENLIEFVKDLLRVDEEHIENAIISCKVNEDVFLEKIEDEEWVFLRAFHIAESNISEKLTKMLRLKNSKTIDNFSKVLKEVEERNIIELSEMQIEAIKMVNENNITIITGGPGTGKTTIIRTIIDVFEEYNKKVTLCAPTGRAAKKMTESTGKEAKTIHRLLELGNFEENRMANVDQYIEQIDTDILIIDEMSMVDVFLMNYLIKGIRSSTKLVLVGDINQLPSVGPGAVLKDLINSEKVPTVSLNKIFRQAAQSKIVVNAHNVNNGEGFIKSSDDLKEDFFYINETQTDKVLKNIISLSTERLKKYGDYDFLSNIQVITPTKKGGLGTKELNNQLQRYLNPGQIRKKEKQYGETVFREGDRIMQIRNNYDIDWKRDKETGKGIFNGEFGIIRDIDEREKTLKIVFDDEKEAIYNFNELEQLELSYAITIHKSQGSEFDVVILVTPSTTPMLLTRNLLYTAITRAKKLLVVIGNDKIIEFMIKNTHVKHRNTGLQAKM